MKADGPVVVGINHFDRGRVTLEVAAEEAALRGAPLRVVHAEAMVGPVLPPVPVAVGERVPGPSLFALLDDAADEVRRSYPQLEVTTEICRDAAVVPALLHESERAQLLVVGLNRGGLRKLLGSTADAVARHASCPVLVARDSENSAQKAAAGEVVVGVDGSDAAAAAVEFAFGEASRRGIGLIAVHAVESPALVMSESAAQPLEADAEAQKDLLANVVASSQRRYPEVTVTQRLVQGSPGWVLSEQSQGATLLVVGTRGRGGFAALLLGSTSYTVLHAAACPVAVVPASR